MEKGDSWHHGVSPLSHQARLDSLLTALKNLADAGLGAASVLANLHHRRIVPVMERELRIYEMSETANPTSLACSQFLNDRLLLKYAATRVRRTMNLRAVKHNNDDLWPFVMLPDATAVSRLSFPSYSLTVYRRGFDDHFLAGVTFEAARSDPPTPRAQAAARTTQRREQERAARKERKIRWRERRE
jgi:hypothetical protein